MALGPPSHHSLSQGSLPETRWGQLMQKQSFIMLSWVHWGPEWPLPLEGQGPGSTLVPRPGADSKVAAEMPGPGEHTLYDTRLLGTSRTGDWDGAALPGLGVTQLTLS